MVQTTGRSGIIGINQAQGDSVMPGTQQITIVQESVPFPTPITYQTSEPTGEVFTQDIQFA